MNKELDCNGEVVEWQEKLKFISLKIKTIIQ
jgi:hypothetical protein